MLTLGSRLLLHPWGPKTPATRCGTLLGWSLVSSFSAGVGSRVSAPSGELPVIRIPQKTRLRAEQKLKRAAGSKVPALRLARPGRLLIMGKRPELNQHAAYTFGKFDPIPLVTKGWKHRKATGDYFVINNTRSQPPACPGEEQREKLRSFSSLGLCGELGAALDGMGISQPNGLQVRTMTALQRGRNVLCAAETGSGKTLSYLLPILQSLAQETAVGETAESNGLRSLVLVPSRELAEQLQRVARTLAADLKLNVWAVGGGRGMGKLKLSLSRGPIDLLVSTPGALWKALRRDLVTLGDLSHLVLDEADTLFDESFVDLLEAILQHCQIAGHPSESRGPGRKAQLVVTGATFPGGVGELLSNFTDLGSITTIKSKELHRIMPHVKQKFLKVKRTDKASDLLQMLKELVVQKTGVLVFCNSASTVNWLGYVLDDHGIKHSRLQGSMQAGRRSGIFSTFQQGLVDILLCTDIASRGLDTQRVAFVINYDFPMTLCDYIHRAGRVGRVGSKVLGTVVSFVTHPWEVELVQKIETAARQKVVLPGLESEIEQPAKKSVAEQFKQN
ncbi:probable ATP-dependent RNA helicase DDX28 [Stegostoma tigrinum]|uniref:probable ATP-dependent RNA helicase DDX28 n=1 Tax=Stegostoma tigrinum TaxID=3053191 RepID=UPI0028708FF0|nr:probable ATP-dependent RNA helicase DDX28 [Stegostoma tigrinum]